eukprot:m.298457 g.298457  ORF g.298457 m.298457 type:complete len:338 (-) comp19536_c0_seq23:263-1276(-)
MACDENDTDGAVVKAELLQAELEEENQRLLGLLVTTLESRGVRSAGSSGNVPLSLEQSEEQRLLLSKQLIDVQLENTGLKEDLETTSYELASQVLKLESKLKHLTMENKRLLAASKSSSASRGNQDLRIKELSLELARTQQDRSALKHRVAGLERELAVLTTAPASSEQMTAAGLSQCKAKYEADLRQLQAEYALDMEKLLASLGGGSGHAAAPDNAWAELRKSLREFTSNTQSKLEQERAALVTRCIAAEEKLARVESYAEHHVLQYQQEILRLRSKVTEQPQTQPQSRRGSSAGSSDLLPTSRSPRSPKRSPRLGPVRRSGAETTGGHWQNFSKT